MSRGKCIPHYTSLLSPLEDAIKGLQGQQNNNMDITQCQNELKYSHSITIPKPDDKLIITVDSSPINKGVGATLFIVQEIK